MIVIPYCGCWPSAAAATAAGGRAIYTNIHPHKSHRKHARSKRLLPWEKKGKLGAQQHVALAQLSCTRHIIGCQPKQAIEPTKAPHYTREQNGIQTTPCCCGLRPYPRQRPQGSRHFQSQRIIARFKELRTFRSHEMQQISHPAVTAASRIRVS